MQKTNAKKTPYTAKIPDSTGFIHWDDDEHLRWSRLCARQLSLLSNRACKEYMRGLDLLSMSMNHIPQLQDIDRVLQQTTGWQTAAVPSLINFTEFFTLLSNKQFPVATFIRRESDFDYLHEPDIFHELFGHCPLLTNPSFAHFTHMYGKLGLAANKEEREFLARLYWFTVEFGLIQTNDGLRIYGGGILSSPSETIYAVESTIPKRKAAELIEMLRTPYKIDQIQTTYFVISSFEQLYKMANSDLMSLVDEARDKGVRVLD